MSIFHQTNQLKYKQRSFQSSLISLKVKANVLTVNYKFLQDLAPIQFLISILAILLSHFFYTISIDFLIVSYTDQTHRCLRSIALVTITITINLSLVFCIIKLLQFLHVFTQKSTSYNFRLWKLWNAWEQIYSPTIIK